MKENLKLMMEYKRSRQFQVDKAEKLFLSISEYGEANYYLYLIYTDIEDMPLINHTTEQYNIIMDSKKIKNEKAMNYLLKAEELNNGLARLELGKIYDNGLYGMEKDSEKGT